jgi:hypothetical protein
VVTSALTSSAIRLLLLQVASGWILVGMQKPALGRVLLEPATLGQLSDM